MLPGRTRMRDVASSLAATEYKDCPGQPLAHHEWAVPLFFAFCTLARIHRTPGANRPLLCKLSHKDNSFHMAQGFSSLVCSYSLMASYLLYASNATSVHRVRL